MKNPSMLPTVHTPRTPLLALAGLLLATLVTVSAVRLTGVGAVHVQDAPTVASRDFTFLDRADGSISVFDAQDHRLLDTVAPGTNGFLRGTMRGLARERHRRGIGAETPFRMDGHADGRLTLEDPTTGRRVDLGSFGPTNAAVFARIMASAMAASRPDAKTDTAGATADRLDTAPGRAAEARSEPVRPPA